MISTYYCGKNCGILVVAALVSPCGWTVDSNKWQEPALESWLLAGRWAGTSNKDVCGHQPRPALLSLALCCYCAQLSFTLNTSAV